MSGLTVSSETMPAKGGSVTSAKVSRPVLPVKYNDDKPSTVFGTKGSGKGKFNYPRDVAVVDNTLHITDNNNYRVCVHTMDGDYLSSYPVSGPPCGITVSPVNQLMISHGDKVTIRDVSGQVTAELGGYGDKPGQFHDPDGVATDADGLWYICDCWNNRVQAMDQSGSVVRMIGTTGPGELEYPLSVAVHPLTGDIYVASVTMEKVTIYSHDGKYQDSITVKDIPWAKGFKPGYVSFRSDGLLCISDCYSDSLYILKDGVHIQTIGRKGDAPGQFNSPHGTVFTNTGHLVVCDWDNHRIQVFTT